MPARKKPKRSAAKLSDIAAFLDDELKVGDFKDSSANGLQVEGRAEVRKVALAVDACMDSMRAAVAQGADMMVVHHGLIWRGGLTSIRGIARRRIAYLLKNELGLYGVHLPLDAHAKLGNNACLARILGLGKLRPFCAHMGKTISFAGELPRAKTGREVAALLAEALDTKTRVAGDAGKPLRSIGIVSGGGAFSIAEAHESGLDGLVTGEGSHAATLDAADSGIVVIYAGHYETETLGVREVGKLLAKRFGVETVFVEGPRSNARP